MSKLHEHFNRMTGMAAAYVSPEPYKNRNGDLSTWDDGLERRGLRDNLFAADMVYMLDGPEQREACESHSTIGQVTLKLDTQLMPYCELIRQWAEGRNLIAGSNSQAQTVKLFEEGGEVASAVARGNRDALKDGIGDMIVVLTILAAQNDLTVEECVAAAYDEIKDRKGRMVDGVFRKDAEQ